MNEITREQLLEIADSPRRDKNCQDCSLLLCIAWESVPSFFELGKLQTLGTLRIEGAEECWNEYHPDGTNLWSENAPISVTHYPYNRSDVCECTGCKRKFLRYTEYGGYYLEERIRELDRKLMVV